MTNKEDIADLGLQEFLEAIRSPAGIIRLDPHLNSSCTSSASSSSSHSSHTLPNGRSYRRPQVEIIWSNSELTPNLEELVLSALVNEDDLSFLSHDGREELVTECPRDDDIPGQSNGRSLIWRLTSLRGGEYLTVIGREEASHACTSTTDLVSSSPSPSSPPTSPSISLNSTSRSPWISARASTPEANEFIQFFSAQDWSSGILGEPRKWCQSLLTMVNMCLASPFPVLISWGPKKVLLYNEPYSKVIGTKHPHILGMPYDEAWPEIWDSLRPVVESAYEGNVVHVDDQEMFLMRKHILEETYFTWSMIPLRGPSGSIDGLYIPNFDRSTAVITNRRIKTLHDVSKVMSMTTTPEQIFQSAKKGLSLNPRDLGFVLLYSAENMDTGSDRGVSKALSSRSYSTSTRSGGDSDNASRRLSNNLEEVEMQFTLAGVIGAIESNPMDDLIPHTIISHRTENIEDEETNLLAHVIRQSHAQDKLILLDGTDLDIIRPCMRPNVFGDIPHQAVVLPIRASVEDRLHGMLVIGLNSRLTFNEAYSNFVGLVKSMFATGVASSKLHREEMQRAEYLATVNRQKNKELEIALDRKTQELKETELKFISAFEVSPAGIWIAAAEGNLEYVNAAYRNQANLQTGTDLERWVDTVHPEDKARVIKEFETCMDRKVISEFRFLTDEKEEDGTAKIRWVTATGMPRFYDPDTVTGVRKLAFTTGAIMDITARKEAEIYQRRRADDALAMRRQLEDFIDFTSHELRNPLSAIGMAVEGVNERLEAIKILLPSTHSSEADQALHDANVVTMCTSHMQRLVDDILLLSKLDSDMLVIVPVPCQPVEIARGITKILGPEMTGKGIEYSLELGSRYHELVNWVEVDPQRVAQILINLVNNAIKFTRLCPTRNITISVDASDTVPDLGELQEKNDNSLASPNSIYLIYAVQDSGLGIAYEEAKKLFQRFQQGFRTSITYGGSGLGLYLCKKMTRRLGGDIALKTELGHGSTFTFYIEVERCEAPAQDPKVPLLPNIGARKLSKEEIIKTMESHVVPPAVAPSLSPAKSLGPPPSVELRKPRSLHVLLTEDNLINQSLLRRALTKSGFIVAVANNGVEALDYIMTTAAVSGSGTPLDCILMDIEMPLMGGIECTGEIRNLEAKGVIQQRLPIIAVTANARSGQVQEMLASGFDDAVAKPFSTKELSAKIKDLAENS